MTTKNIDWDTMLEMAKLQQQEYYENFAEWTKYKEHEYKYLKQNIGFALFGPPSEDTKNDVTFSDEDQKIDNMNIINSICYSSNANKIIQNIYQKIYKFGEGCIESKTIYYGLIFNITIFTESSKTKPDSGKEIETNSEVNKKTNSETKNKLNLSSTPIFKINRGCSQICYIDIFGRMYNSWDDYKNNNTLPKCTMILPKDGSYQPDINNKITEDISTVWLEILDSPACRTLSTVVNILDKTSLVIGIGGLCLTASSFFTPLAPITAGATLSTAATGLWGTFKSARQLTDRWSHKESISLADRDAFCAWLTITSCATGLITTGGTTVLNKLIKSGRTVGNATQFSYNAVLISHLGVHGISMGYQGYCTYEKYKAEKSIPFTDIAILVTNILFYSQSVLQAQFAENLIKSNQTKILDDYRASIRSKNLRKKFNRVRKKAAMNNDDILSENAEVIRYINRRIDLKRYDNLNPISTQKSNTLLFKDKIMEICGISLIDPFQFVEILLKFYKNPEKQDSNETTFLHSQEDDNTEHMFCQLQNLLRLLKNKFLNDNEFDTTKIEDILHDMKYLDNAPFLFDRVFKIALQLIKQYCYLYLDLAIKFMWYYVKESVRQACLGKIAMKNKAIEAKLCDILNVLFDSIDIIVLQLLPAYKTYISRYFEENI